MPAGGRKPGAGRKSNLIREINKLQEQIPKLDAARILADLQAEKRLKSLVRKGSASLSYAIMRDLMDRAYGKPAATVTHEGQVDVKVVIDL